MEKNLSNSQRIHFLYQSIADTQATIRAIDVKTGFLFVITFIPYTELNKLIGVCKQLNDASSLYLFPIALVSILWGLAVLALFSCTVSISDPKKHIEGDLPEGVFFTNALFKLNFINNFLNSSIKSNVTLQEYMDKIPANDDSVIKELSFEKMKLSYIQNVKIKRSSFCSIMSFSWIFLSGVIWLFFIFKVGF